MPLVIDDEYNAKEKVNHPKHYNQYPIEVIDMMRSIWGDERTRYFCLMNAFKYRMRLGHKGHAQEDLDKEQLYLKKAKDLDVEHFQKSGLGKNDESSNNALESVIEEIDSVFESCRSKPFIKRSPNAYYLNELQDEIMKRIFKAST